jgi:hypothetical protein
MDISFSLHQAPLSPPYTGLIGSIRSFINPLLNQTINLNAYASTFSQKADISFCGWGSGSISLNPISSWTIKSISP